MFSFSKAIVPVLMATICLLNLSAPLSAQNVTVFETRVTKTIEYVQTFHTSVDRLGRSGHHVQKKRDLYNAMAAKLTIQKEHAHLPFPEPDVERQWTIDACKVAKGLKPNINYLVKKSREDSVICGSQAAIDNLYNNVKLIAWYHNELDQNYSDERLNEGAMAVGRLIDEYFSILADGIPRVKIKKTGRINIAKDQQLQYSEIRLWQIMSVINRYFFYKIQVHADRQDFYPADFLLMNAMIKTAAIYGAEPPRSALRNIKVELSPNGNGWRQDAHIALDSWEKELNEDYAYPQTLVAIKIPPKAAPKPKTPPKKEKKEDAGSGFPSDVEDVKEVGGQIFIKRAGRWQPWNKK